MSRQQEHARTQSFRILSQLCVATFPWWLFFVRLVSSCEQLGPGQIVLHSKRNEFFSRWQLCVSRLLCVLCVASVCLSQYAEHMCVRHRDDFLCNRSRGRRPQCPPCGRQKAAICSGRSHTCPCAPPSNHAVFMSFLMFDTHTHTHKHEVARRHAQPTQTHTNTSAHTCTSATYALFARLRRACVRTCVQYSAHVLAGNLWDCTSHVRR